MLGEIRSSTFKLADAILFDRVTQPWELPEQRRRHAVG